MILDYLLYDRAKHTTQWDLFIKIKSEGEESSASLWHEAKTLPDDST